MTRGAKGVPIGASNSKLIAQEGLLEGESKYETTYKIKKTAWECSL